MWKVKALVHSFGHVLVSDAHERIAVGHLVDESADAEYVRLAVVALKIPHLGRHERQLHKTQTSINAKCEIDIKFA